MAVDLEDRATTALQQLRIWSDRVGGALGTARVDLDHRDPRPDQIPPADWAARLGATQHVATARATLAVLRAERDRIRAQLAAVANPADTATFENALRANLVQDAQLRVQLRLAQERVAAAESRVATFTALFGLAEPAAAALEAELKVATRREVDGAALQDALTAAPLATLVADATALRTGSLPAARARLAALLPDPLGARALTRALEAAAFGSAAATHHDDGQARSDQLHAAEAPVTTAVEVAERRFVLAEAALRNYVHTAPAELAAAGLALQRVTALPDLSAAQVQALAPAQRAAAVAAATAEQELATAVAALQAAERAVADARADALLADPDADPELDQAVIDAIKARDADAVQVPLAEARADYDAVAQAALDAWEVEVPDRLWIGAADLAAATTSVERLADQAERDTLQQDLDDARDALAAALDARDAHLRATLAVAIPLADRAAQQAAAGATGADRVDEYLRGDGPGGRTPAQL